MVSRATSRRGPLLWWHRRPWWRAFAAIQLPKRQRRRPKRSTSKDRCDGPAPHQQDGGTPPDQRRPARAAVRELSEVSRELFASPPPPSLPPAPLPPILKLEEARRGGPPMATAEYREAIQQDDLHQLQLPLLDMRLLNAIMNKRIAEHDRERAFGVLKMHARYTKRLAAYNPKWRSIADKYEARVSLDMAAWSRAHCRV